MSLIEIDCVELVSDPHIHELLHKILKNQEKIMSAVTDLQVSVAALNTSVSNEIAAIQTALANDPDGPAIEAVVAQLGTLKSNLDAETAALTAPATDPNPIPQNSGS